ncbi:MAG: hypothetical protein GQ574_07965 [Crocinitomix sp.]|nr:hypothetical protein [Crocinitomix sp.]
MKFRNLYWIIVCGLSLLLIKSLLTEDVNKNNLTYYFGTFNSLNRHDSRGRSTSYNLYLNEHEKSFKISASFWECFDYGNFDLRVEPGDSLTVGVSSNDGPIRRGSVSTLDSRWHSFYDFECKNTPVNLGKKNISITCVLIILILTIIFIKMKKTPNVL